MLVEAKVMTAENTVNTKGEAGITTTQSKNHNGVGAFSAGENCLFNFNCDQDHHSIIT